MRTLPLVPFIRERLLALKEEQAENRRLCGKCCNRDYLAYICVNEIGDLIKPSYVTEQFPKLLDKYDMRHIRFHDLRHSCASLLLKNGVQMKEIQDWLGYSDFSTTAKLMHTSTTPQNSLPLTQCSAVWVSGSSPQFSPKSAFFRENSSTTKELA